MLSQTSGLLMRYCNQYLKKWYNTIHGNLFVIGAQKSARWLEMSAGTVTNIEIANKRRTP